MSTYDFPVSPNRLIELPLVFKYFDKRYGPPDTAEPKKKNGEYTLRLIMKYLSQHKRSTCEEIAQYEYDKAENLSSQIKLKSITDDVRKFLKNNLIDTEIVYQDEPKKKYNKKVETYSLSPIGIMYSMYLFAKFSKRDEEGSITWEDDDLKKDQDLVKTLGKEYSETFPKVFGRFELFEKILGKGFESFLINPFLEIFNYERGGVPHKDELLTDHVLTSYEYLYSPHFNSIRDVHKFIADQISLIFYVHLEEAIVNTLRDKIDEDPKFRNKDGTYKYRESLNQAREMWIQIMDEDKELKKWYDTFLKNATKAKRDEYGEVYSYRKEVYAHWDFPSNKYP